MATRAKVRQRLQYLQSGLVWFAFGAEIVVFSVCETSLSLTNDRAIVIRVTKYSPLAIQLLFLSISFSSDNLRMSLHSLLA